MLGSGNAATVSDGLGGGGRGSVVTSVSAPVTGAGFCGGPAGAASLPNTPAMPPNIRPKKPGSEPTSALEGVSGAEFKPDGLATGTATGSATGSAWVTWTGVGVEAAPSGCLATTSTVSRRGAGGTALSSGLAFLVSAGFGIGGISAPLVGGGLASGAGSAVAVAKVFFGGIAGVSLSNTPTMPPNTRPNMPGLPPASEFAFDETVSASFAVVFGVAAGFGASAGRAVNVGGADCAVASGSNGLRPSWVAGLGVASLGVASLAGGGSDESRGAVWTAGFGGGEAGAGGGEAVRRSLSAARSFA